MSQLVGVAGAPAIYVVGLADALKPTTYSVDPVTDPVDWAANNPQEILLIRVAVSAGFNVIADVRENAEDLVVVTVLDDFSSEAVANSLRAGATGSVALDSPPEDVIRAIEAGQTRSVVLPTSWARIAFNAAGKAASGHDLSEADMRCLQALARDETVASLARELGYSEREMYRRLNHLYTKMGARSRTAAILNAARSGLLD